MQLEDAIASNNLAQAKAILEAIKPWDLGSLGLLEQLAIACDQGKLEMVELFINSGVAVNDPDAIIYPHMLPISRAAGKGHLTIVKLLLDAGAEVNYRSP